MNLQESIRDLSKELNYLYLISNSPYDACITKIINALDMLSLTALKKTLDENTTEYKIAGKAIKSAITETERAVEDLNKISDAIKKGVQVVKILDKLLARLRQLGVKNDFFWGVFGPLDTSLLSWSDRHRLQNAL